MSKVSVPAESDDAPSTSRSAVPSDRSTSDVLLLRLMTRLRDVPARALPCVPRCVLHVVADHVSRKNGLSWPKVETIAKEAGVSESTAREALLLLVRCGWLRVVTEATPRDAARYEVQLEGKPVDDVLAENPRRKRVPRGGGLPAGTQGAAVQHPDRRQPAPRVPPEHTQGAAGHTRSSHKAPSEAPREPHKEAPTLTPARERARGKSNGQVTIPFEPSSPKAKAKAIDSYADAWVAGNADAGARVSRPTGSQVACLGRAAYAHARYRDGSAITGEDLLRWLRAKACSFRASVDEPAKQRGGMTPFGLLQWLDDAPEQRAKPWPRPGERDDAGKPKPPPPPAPASPLPVYTQVDQERAIKFQRILLDLPPLSPAELTAAAEQALSLRGQAPAETNARG